MKNKKVYLCGGINALSDDDCNNWRKYCIEQLSCETLNPMRRDYRGKEDSHYCEIVKGDKQDIDKSNIILVNATKPSWGTAMEILYAWENGKIIISVVGKIISPWLRFHSTYLEKSFDDAIRRINNENIHR